MKLAPNDWKVTMNDLNKFGKKLEKMFAAHTAKNYPMLKANKVEIDVGPKYARVWTVNSQKMAYAFINMMNGDILKPATWRAPAKHARGNIFNKNALEGCGPYGVAYLR